MYDSSDWRLSLEYLVPGSLPPPVVGILLCDISTWFLSVPGFTNAGARRGIIIAEFMAFTLPFIHLPVLLKLSPPHLILALQLS